MDSTHRNTGKEVTLEEKFVNLTDQLSSVTERLDHAEHDLDLERVSREDIIRAEIERRMAEERRKLEEEFAEKVRLVEQEKKDYEDTLRRKLEKQEADLEASYAYMTQEVIADAHRQIEEARQKAEGNGIARMASMTEAFFNVFVKMTDGDITEGQALLRQYQDLARETEEVLKDELKDALDKAGNKAGKVLCHCDGHPRRKFENALKENPKLAKIGVTLKQQIYAVEEMIKAIERKTGRKMTAEEKVQFRNENAGPLWKILRLWCTKEITNLPLETKIYEAMNYLLCHYDELTAYLNIADMPLDNTDTNAGSHTC